MSGSHAMRARFYLKQGGLVCMHAACFRWSVDHNLERTGLVVIETD